MKRLINSKDMRDFLKDFKTNSQTIILEEGKANQELETIAKARGIKLKGNKDLAGFKTIYTFANKANKNRARLPKEVLLKALPTMIGKPVDIDHDRGYVIGHYIDYKYIHKDDMVVAYGVFYKSNFANEWEQAKKLFKKKKLSTSYEIWCPEKKRKYREDGTYDLLEQEIAGGALLYNTEPAFEDAKVLEVAKKNVKNDKDLVYANKYKKEELLTEEEQKTSVPVVKMKCSNCGEEFDSGIEANIKCPKCFAILDKSGNMIYPPQIKDFKLLCPSCKVNNWLILSNKDEKSNVRCMNCAKEYELTFETEKKKEGIEGFQFLYTGKVRCLQCGNIIHVAGTSAIKERTIKCKKCGLEFSYDITHERTKKISAIKELNLDKGEKKVEKSSLNEFEGKSFDETKKIIHDRIEKSKETVEEAKKKYSCSCVKCGTKVTSEEHCVNQKCPKCGGQMRRTDRPGNGKPDEKKKPIDKSKSKYYKTKVLRKAIAQKKELEKKLDKASKTEEKVEVLVSGIRKLADKIKKMQKTLTLYEANAKEIIKRKETLGEYANDMTDEEILNDDKFALKKAEMENASLRAQLETSSENEEDVVGLKPEHTEEWYANYRKKVNEHAFGKK